MDWLHPIDRADASDELRLLGMAWRARLSSFGAYSENDSACPQWAADVLSAFAAENPGFDVAECMLPEWKAEKKAAFNAAQQARKNAQMSRDAAIKAAMLARDLSALVQLHVASTELCGFDDLPAVLPVAIRRGLIFDRAKRAIGVAK